MRVLIIGSTKVAVDETVRNYYQKYVNFFQRSADTIQSDAIIETSLVDDLIISVGDGQFTMYDARHKRDLSDYDVFFFRADNFRTSIDVVGTINEFAHENNIRIINEYNGIKDSSKLLQAVWFHKLSIPVARTLYVNPGLLENPDAYTWDFPCVMKAIHGSHGNDNYVVNSLDDVKAHQDEQSDKRFVLQRFVPNDGDYRILVIGGEVLVIGRSAVGGSHLNNTSKGGEAVLVPADQLPVEVIENAKKIMKYLGKTIAGVDALADKNTGEYSFLEVNDQPQLMSGAFLEEKEALMGKLLGTLDKN